MKKRIFKKSLPIVLLLMIFSCVQEPYEPFTMFVPEKLKITNKVGIKLEEVFVENKVSMNVKLETSGKYRVKIKTIGDNLVSQEVLEAKEGDNILTVYASSLPKSTYRIELCDFDHNVLGFSIFVLK